MSAWSCSFTIHELHLRVTAKCCKFFFLALKTRFTPLQSFSCACKFYLRLQSYVHFHKSYHTHANLLGVKLPSYEHIYAFSRRFIQSDLQSDKVNGFRLSIFPPLFNTRCMHTVGLAEKWSTSVKLGPWERRHHFSKSVLLNSLFQRTGSKMVNTLRPDVKKNAITCTRARHMH